MRYLLFLIGLCYILSTQGQDSTTWSIKADFGGGSRVAGCGFSMNGKGYFMGGTDLTNDYGDLWQYDPAGNQWAQKASWPGGATREPIAFVIGEYAYAGLGLLPGATKHISAMYRYDPSQNKWTAIASFPEGRRAAGVFVIDSLAYVMGGFEYGYTANRELWCYNPRTDKWTQKASYPSSIPVRSYPICASANGKGYMLCGFNQGAYYKDAYRYDPVSDSWTQINDFPGTARTTASCFVINNTIYVGCGRDLNGSMAKDWYAYDPSSSKWRQVAGFPSDYAYGNAYFTLNGKGYAGGGNNGTACSNGFFEFSANVSELRTIPLQTEPAFSIKYLSDKKNILIESGYAGMAYMNVYDMTGRLLHKQEAILSAGVTEIVLPEVANGVYILEAIQNKRRAALKIQL